MNSNILITLAYDGTRYDGWQKQGNTDNTIQGKIEAILYKMTGTAIEIAGSGRTDAGVHAKAQTANFHIATDMTPEAIMAYMNKYLPDDISVLSAINAAPRFHSRLSATGKTYRYVINMNAYTDVFNRRFELHHPDSLNIKAMKEAASYLIGTHDFMSFCDTKRMKKSTIRTIENVDLTVEDNKLYIDYTGNGFLYHMARLITGTLIFIGEGKASPDYMEKVIDARDRSLCGPLAPSCGLTLMNVRYDSI